MILPYGHEVACHGLTHDHKMAFDTMGFEDQKSHLSQAKKILEDISGKEVVSFRAPALRVNEFTARALAETGFLYDSSVAPQRLDMFMTLGSNKKLKWLLAPRNPYQTDIIHLSRAGTSGIYEIPVSSFGLPYVGTFMRVSPAVNNIIRYLLYLETKNSTKPINFLIHPNELIEEPSLHTKTERRAKSYIGYILSDLLRKKLKQKNLGSKSLPLLESQIVFWKDHGYSFTTINNYFAQAIKPA
jgi:hypothetical protein